MHPIITARLDELRTLCEKHCVKALYAFGSATRDDFDPESSDLDFLVEFEPLPPGRRADAYFGLLEGLGELLGCEIDLIVGSAIRNPYFERSVEETKVPVYAAA